MKSKKIIKLFIYIIILTFMFSYIKEKSGYYEYNLQTKKNLTEEEIKKFEQDVKEGRDVDITDYLKDNTTDYSNNLTRATSKLSINLNEYLNKAISNTFDILGRLIK